MSDVNPTAVGMLPVAIAFLAAFIAWQQMKIARAKVVIDLFRQRYDVMGEITRYVGQLVAEDSDANRAAFWEAVTRAKFLFPAEITSFLRPEIAERSAQLLAMRAADRRDTKLGHEIDYARINLISDMEIWFKDSSELIEKKFKPYLTIVEV